jgi:hypothetical protein
MLTINKIIKRKYWVASVSALVLVCVVIPFTVSLLNPYSPTKMPSDAYLKNGSPIFFDLLKQIKKENGLLILGTSETGNFLDGNNYYHLLNRDTELDRKVYTFGGAGRNANVYFPLMLKNPDVFKGLDLIFYLNPTYWRKGLNGFSQGYFDRYVDPTLVATITEEAKSDGLYEGFMSKTEIHPAVKESEIEKWADAFQSLYYFNLVQLLAVNEDDNTIILSQYLTPEREVLLKDKIDLTHNVTPDFLKKDFQFPPIDTNSTYQDELLLQFIKMCKKLEVNATIYLGPYNAIYCQQMNPELLLRYELQIEKIKALLHQNNMPYIDGDILVLYTGYL